MKFVSDSEQVFPRSTVGHKPNSEHFDYHENGLDSTGLNSENCNVKEHLTDALCASKSNEGVSDDLPHVSNDADGWTARKLDHSTSLNDLAKNNETDVRDLEAPNSHSCGEMESFEDLVFYLDKRVIECELPELIVCYKENTCHVKDICIDEGVRSYDRIMFESNVDEKGVRAFFSPEEDRNSKLMEETKNSVMPIPDVLKSYAENDYDEDIVNQCDTLQGSGSSDEDIVDLCDSKDLMPAGEVKDVATDEITNDASKKLFSLGYLFSMDNVGTENSHSKSSKDNELDAEKEPFQFQGSSGKMSLANPASACSAEGSNCGTEEAIFDLVPASEESQNGSGEAILASPDLVSATGKTLDNSGETLLASTDLVSASDESTKISTSDNLSHNNNVVDTGSITFDFDASAGVRDKEEHLRIGDSQRIETLGTFSLEDAPHQSVSSQVHCGLGESSFSVAGSLPSLISYETVAYSGSVSLRSDSSTTSTRSFAFPILQSEWNSSPVRMAKADRRRYWKHKWRQGLLCCRF